ncbi:hypothetical protein HBB16_14105 [Pseudonocardia sp. MCCB 268]|nr:hypothetical protein [Pseudonocardia cytotoxica]
MPGPRTAPQSSPLVLTHPAGATPERQRLQAQAVHLLAPGAARAHRLAAARPLRARPASATGKNVSGSRCVSWHAASARQSSTLADLRPALYACHLSCLPHACWWGAARVVSAKIPSPGRTIPLLLPLFLLLIAASAA